MTPIIPRPLISPSEEAIIEGKLVRLIRDGLAEAGISTGNRRYGLIYVDSLNWPIAVSIRAYTRDVPIWRITFGGRGEDPWPCLVEAKELTLHLSEFSTHTGVELAHLLREPKWRWPLFDHDHSYPGYAWSKLAYETYESYRLERVARQQRIAEGGDCR